LLLSLSQGSESRQPKQITVAVSSKFNTTMGSIQRTGKKLTTEGEGEVKFGNWDLKNVKKKKKKKPDPVSPLVLPK
jgi:hypothetical protein